MAKSKIGVLIISYTFPPKEGIGGRRWAKFATHLAKSNYNIHVIHQNPKQNENSIWQNDIKHPNITTYPINPFHPKSFGFFGSSSLISKITFHFWKHFLLSFYQGVIFDRTLFWKRNLHKTVKNVLNHHDISYLIVTIPPFLLASHVLKLKRQYPKIKFVIDYRDPWTENKSFHGFKDISRKRLRFEQRIERKAIESADLVFSTTSQMNLWNQSKSTETEKFKVLENGFDWEEIKINNNANKVKKTFTFLLAGSIYVGLNYITDPFIEFISTKEKSNSEFSKSFEFIFIGSANDNLEQIVKDKRIKSVKILPRVSRFELNNYYNDADFFMMFSAFDHGFNFNTKFYEYLPYKKPIIHFGPQGDITEFLELNKIGIGVSPDNFLKEIDFVLKQIESGNLKFNNDFDVNQFEVKYLTKKLISFFENKTQK